MNANRNTGITEIRALSAAELDAVSGGETMSYSFTVAGMRIHGFGSSTGEYQAQVAVGRISYGGGGQL
jgi:hypothetical protein